MVPKGALVLRSCPLAQRCLSLSASALGGVPTQIGPSDEATASTTSYLGYLSGAINAVLAKTSAATQVLGLRSDEGGNGPSKAVVTEISEGGAPTKAQFLKHTFKKRISRAEVTSKTRALVKKLLVAETSSSKLHRIQELSSHILAFPPTRIIAAQQPQLIADLLTTVTSPDTSAELQAEARQCLTLCGCQPQSTRLGVNLLSIDGGGTRGMMGLEVLEQLEQISGKRVIGEDLRIIETSKSCVPRLSIVASIVNSPVLQPYVFRNYEHPAGRDSHYMGSASYQLWQAIQASAAAPLYFEEVKLGNFLLQDGGVCDLESEEAAAPSSLSSLQKFNRIIDSATDTEGVHMCMHDLLDENVYFRLNPYMTFPYGLDEIDPKKLEQMQNDAKLYVRRNSAKIADAASRLLEHSLIWYQALRTPLTLMEQ
ncbi:phospholipase, patatin family [Ancylostoma ceylanicum]|uniref:Phospholipase, patatin family n=1 Tax=Ancylostoma ceylanicum TaxID=53326 RepID=A0A0D6M7J3_9BILA|nr:phospholipase, patatin family [Ancylostoma ceylanicum]